MGRGSWMFVGLAAVLVLLATCNPFESMTTDKGFTIADGNGATLELLTPDRRLPKSATNIAGHILHFQDTSLQVRFDAPLADAEVFQTEMLRGKGRSCGYLRPAKIEGWPTALPKQASCLTDNTVDDHYPAITVVVVPRDQQATVYVTTFGD